MVTAWFSFSSGTRQSTPCTGSLLPTEGRSQEGAGLWVPSSGCAARWCSGSQNPAPCSLWLWERFCTHGQPSPEPGHGARGERAQQGGPAQHFGCDGLPVLFPGVRTCCGLSKRGWQKQDLSCVPIPIFFLPRALGNGCPECPTALCHRAPCWGQGHHPC